MRSKPTLLNSGEIMQVLRSIFEFLKQEDNELANLEPEKQEEVLKQLTKQIHEYCAVHRNTLENPSIIMYFARSLLLTMKMENRLNNIKPLEDIANLLKKELKPGETLSELKPERLLEIYKKLQPQFNTKLKQLRPEFQKLYKDILAELEEKNLAKLDAKQKMKLEESFKEAAKEDYPLYGLACLAITGALPIVVLANPGNRMGFVDWAPEYGSRKDLISLQDRFDDPLGSDPLGLNKITENRLISIGDTVEVSHDLSKELNHIAHPAPGLTPPGVR